ncbi:MAG: hypothetical protein Q3M24_13600 [Candidatus Electrothrix aestuarii]|uniref:Uncharacterized protein n=1 Tax=Candidatus Electrothrix aestuarii TaxID=3062594 RepID=A0AAU8LQN7_9BACT|nr:hypothetical protein [Candidatus Electrothrix aestuarii]
MLVRRGAGQHRCCLTVIVAAFRPALKHRAIFCRPFGTFVPEGHSIIAQ